MFPCLYDLALAPAEALLLSRWRRKVVASASGRVLEIGAGTGLNLPHYRQAARLVLTDPDAAMLARARPRATHACCPVDLVVADGEVLPFAAGSFDTVVATLVFCTIPHPERAFAEVRRVLRPTGDFGLLEHVRAPRGWAGSLQDALTPVWKKLANGCHLNRSTLALAIQAGFTVRSLQMGMDGWLLAAKLVLDPVW